MSCEILRAWSSKSVATGSSVFLSHHRTIATPLSICACGYPRRAFGRTTFPHLKRSGSLYPPFEHHASLTCTIFSHRINFAMGNACTESRTQSARLRVSSGYPHRSRHYRGTSLSHAENPNFRFQLYILIPSPLLTRYPQGGYFGSNFRFFIIALYISYHRALEFLP